MDPDFPLLSVFLYMLWFFAFVLWLWLLFAVITDVFRSKDLSGWGKAGWTAAIIILPWVGVIAYLIVRGGSMHDRNQAVAERDERAWRSYLQEAAGSGSGADELGKLAHLHDRGVISDAEFERGKTKILA
ncbi:SHOCT domain-containing protein [Frankia sp. AgB32]|uniref:SHOCT domain-containing protein n=1 Tax=Frankia sp. AgB32 TaxID=631119 RepID=UPI00200DF578|nr:SHOCT domain-containing protein [Frankia sp. AgB32]MCK9895365.1 SHOCT domain-containing protein [Frankia sp. AgB32]